MVFPAAAVEYYRDELEKQAGSPKVTFDSIVTQNPHFIAMKKKDSG